MTRGLPAFTSHPAPFQDSRAAGLFRGRCVGVVDGDTYDVLLDLGFQQYPLIALRLFGVDTPELRSRDEAERAAAREARDRAIDLLLHQDVLVRTYKDRRSFGRYVAEVWVAVPQPAGDVTGASPAGPATGPSTGPAAGPSTGSTGDDAGEDAPHVGAGVEWRSIAATLLAEGLGVESPG